jgi:tetratricopeptide (TPR) repeat protein
LTRTRERKPTRVVAEEYLRLAMAASSPEQAAALAREGLAVLPAGDGEGAVLLYREIFKAHLVAGRPRSAHAVARKMVRAGALPEVTHADLGRACAALGWWARAAQAYRLAARFAPARRRSLHWAACASAFHHAALHEEALAALERALRWSTTTRPLHRGYAALVRIDRGEAVDDLDVVVADLEVARCGEGYGRYVLGRLVYARGDTQRGAGFLREFLRRNVGDPLREATLAGEIRAARTLLQQRRRA